ncbi:putative gmf family protein [Neofusicoccum parvum]|uniref:Gmf family protein n=1 Tax=Neofusicoccum parvum TaxID=310453 RepID=A0ACB5SR29_9PEZI|nr:putative gmf family protein [Neofusicoccum parvum]GME57123.1 putative gmf family protein [Neofusicoccum parvum]
MVSGISRSPRPCGTDLAYTARQQASEARLFTFSPETKDKLRKFRLGTSRAKDAQAVIYQIDKKTLEIAQSDDVVYTNLQEIADELPDNSPRFVLLSYPMTLASGRLSVPYVMIYYLPTTCNSEMKMLYASAKELVRNTAEVNRIIEIADAEDIEGIEDRLQSDA